MFCDTIRIAIVSPASVKFPLQGTEHPGTEASELHAKSEGTAALTQGDCPSLGDTECKVACHPSPFALPLNALLFLTFTLISMQENLLTNRNVPASSHRIMESGCLLWGFCKGTVTSHVALSGFCSLVGASATSSVKEKR